MYIHALLTLSLIDEKNFLFQNISPDKKLSLHLYIIVENPKQYFLPWFLQNIFSDNCMDLEQCFYDYNSELNWYLVDNEQTLQRDIFKGLLNDISKIYQKLVITSSIIDFLISSVFWTQSIV